MSFTAPQDAIKTLFEDFAACTLASTKAEVRAQCMGLLYIDEL
jgi:hypothetical protein